MICSCPGALRLDGSARVHLHLVPHFPTQASECFDPSTKLVRKLDLPEDVDTDSSCAGPPRSLGRTPSVVAAKDAERRNRRKGGAHGQGSYEDLYEGIDDAGEGELTQDPPLEEEPEEENSYWGALRGFIC